MYFYKYYLLPKISVYQCTVCKLKYSVIFTNIFIMTNQTDDPIFKKSAYKSNFDSLLF